MSKELKVKYLFAFSAILIFLISGFSNLKYGLSFIDEGMYLTDAWRIAKGDQLIRDTAKFAPTLYQAISSWLFLANENLSILSVRIIQHTLAATLLLHLAIAATQNSRHRLPFLLIILAPFFYTGLDQTGMSSSFNYYTISQAFLVLYIAEYLSASGTHNSKATKGRIRAIYTSVLIAGMVITYLPLAALIPIHIAYLKIFKNQNLSNLTLNVAIILGAYLLTVGEELPIHLENVMAIGNGRKDGALTVNLYTPATMFLGIVVSALIHYLLKNAAQVRKMEFFFFSVMLSGTLVYSQLRHYFGILPPFWNGWFNIPGSTAGITIGLTLIPLSYFIRDAYRSNYPLSLPAFINAVKTKTTLPAYFFVFAYASLYGATSTLGIMLFSNILPIVATLMAIGVINQDNILEESKRTPAEARRLKGIAVIFISLGVPLSIHDHNFTYFDKAPHALDTRIDAGPAAGILTNELNARLYNDIRKFVSENTREGDYILSFDQTPMAYFMTQRLPAIDHSWVGLTGGDPTAMKKSVAKMVEDARIPTLALHWRNKFLWLPINQEGEYALSGFADSTEEVLLSFVRRNMDFAGSIDVGNERAIEVYFKRKAQNGYSTDG